MDFRFTEEQEKLRQQVRQFLEEELKKGTFEVRCDAWMGGYSPEFSHKIAVEYAELLLPRGEKDRATEVLERALEVGGKDIPEVNEKINGMIAHIRSGS